MAKVQQKFFKTAGGIGSDQGFSLSTNCQRVFLTGQLQGLTGLDFRCHEIKSKSGNLDIVVAGLDLDGCQKFFKTAGRPGTESVGSSITSNCERAFLTGTIGGPTAINFEGNTIDVHSNNFGIFVAGVDNCGHQKFFVTAGDQTPSDLIAPKITANSSRIFVSTALVGTGATDFIGDKHTLLGNGDILVAGLDHRGKQKFFATAGSINSDKPLAIASDECNVFVTGFIQGPTASDFKGDTITLYGLEDIFVAGLSNCGTQKFFKHAGNITTSPISNMGLSISSFCGDVFVTGLIGSGTAVNFKGGPVTTYGNGDIFVSKLNSCGDQKFFITAGGGMQIDEGKSIIANENGIFLTGFIVGPTAVDFSGKEITKLYGNRDIFVAGLSHCGKQKFFVTAGSPIGPFSNDEGLNITANDHGIFVTGFVSGLTATDFNGCSVKNLHGRRDIFVAKLDYCGHQEFFVTAGSSESDQGNQITVRNNEIYVTGLLDGTTGSDFCNHSVKHLQGNGDIFVARLDDLCAKYRSKFSSMPYVPR